MSEADLRFLAAFDANLAMINGQFPLPEETIQAMKIIREAVDQCGQTIKAATVGMGVRYDSGALIHVVQLLQQTKNRACDAIILPHHVKK